MALPISDTIHTNIKAKSPGQFDDGKAYGYQVVDTAEKRQYMLRKGQPAVANGDLNIVLYEINGNKPNVDPGSGLRNCALLLTEADLRREFDGVPD